MFNRGTEGTRISLPTGDEVEMQTRPRKQLASRNGVDYSGYSRNLITAFVLSAPYSNRGRTQVVRLWAGTGLAWLFRIYYMWRQTFVEDPAKNFRLRDRAVETTLLFSPFYAIIGTSCELPTIRIRLQAIINPRWVERQKDRQKATFEGF